MAWYDFLIGVDSDSEQQRYNETQAKLDAARRVQVERGILSEENYQRSAGGRSDTSLLYASDGAVHVRTGPVNVDEELDNAFDSGFDDGVNNISSAVRAP